MEIDRLAPQRRPAGRPVGRQKWRELLFLHWEVDEAALRAVVPASLALDGFAGTYYVGVIPFLMRDVRVRYLPFGLDFLETNVRTYVVRDGVPGIYFFSLEASSWLAVRGARMSFGLPYFHARMSHERDGDAVHYRTERRGAPGARHAVRYRASDASGAPVAAGTLDHFLVERYHLFVERRRALVRAQVHHAPYPVTGADVLAVDDGLVAAAGLAARGAPLAHFSPGVDVEVFAPAVIA